MTESPLVRAVIAATAAALMVTVAACSPMVHVTTEREGAGAAPDEPLQVDLRVLTDAMQVAITNRGAVPVDVLWYAASLVDTQGNASPVVHSGIDDQWAAPDVPGDVSRIPPHGTLNVFIIPDRSVVFDRGSGWYAEPLLPVECGPLRCLGYHELVGKTVRFALPVRENGADRVLDSTLRITAAVKSMRGGRPPEQALQ
jgi:hypothetical protein